MWIVAIAWMYVTLMMALAEATSSQGTVLGAIFTFLLYGVGPLALVLYLLGAPARRKAILKAEREAFALAQQQPAPLQDGGLIDARSAPDSNGVQADGSGLPATTPVAPVREEPLGR